MLLLDLHPRWFGEPNRHGQGIVFHCPHCVRRKIPFGKRQELVLRLKEPLDGGDPERGASAYWEHQGRTFATLTLLSSVDASGFGHWRGKIIRGEIIDAD